jgi:hypothetical protein
MSAGQSAKNSMLLYDGDAYSVAETDSVLVGVYTFRERIPDGSVQGILRLESHVAHGQSGHRPDRPPGFTETNGALAT